MKVLPMRKLLLTLLPALALALLTVPVVPGAPAQAQGQSPGAVAGDSGLAGGLAARAAAERAEAARYAPGQWQKAEAELDKARKRRNPADPG
ncbi:MAG: hypothetical protein KJ041_03805, partial [Gammaproteobacteria bacterium]|nr:hypothetical protein [Gammaproteobacteria bacterium]